MSEKSMIVILGPTASGKTRIAALLAAGIGGEVISADSRQVYRGMDIGTGKDLDDYIVEGVRVPTHLLDIAEPGTAYTIYHYEHDFSRARAEVESRGKQVIVCGGSGMYLETALGLYKLPEVPPDPEFRARAAGMSRDELTSLLISFAKPHNTTDLNERERLIRAIEIAKAAPHESTEQMLQQGIRESGKHLVTGISLPRELVRERITRRLQTRLNEGMLNEIKELLNKGVTPEELMYYGLEYRYLTLYVTGKISYDRMFSDLNTAIHQFSKRQMTWFRRMEKRGIPIRWIDGMQNPCDIVSEIRAIISG